MSNRDTMIKLKDQAADTANAHRENGEVVASAIWAQTSSLFAIAIFAADEVSRREESKAATSATPAEKVDGGHDWLTYPDRNSFLTLRCHWCKCGKAEWEKADRPDCPGHEVKADTSDFRAAGVDG